MGESKVTFLTTAKYFWLAIKPYKWLFWLIFLFWGLSRVGQGIFVPLFYKRIIDIISTTGTPSLIVEDLIRTFLILVSIIIGYQITYRLGEFAITDFQSKVLRDLHNNAFKNLKNHSYSFFTNSFSGSLVAKTKRFVRAFETIHDSILYGFFFVAIQIIGSLIVLFYTNKVLGIVFLSWIVIYVILSFFFSKKKMKYDLISASADSAVTGRLSDVLTNILNLKIFSSGDYEQKEFEEVTEEQRKVQLKAWNIGNIIYAIQSLLLGILEIGSMYLAIRLWLEGSITAGTVVLIQIYVTLMFANLWGLGKYIARMPLE